MDFIDGVCKPTLIFWAWATCVLRAGLETVLCLHIIENKQTPTKVNHLVKRIKPITRNN